MMRGKSVEKIAVLAASLVQAAAMLGLPTTSGGAEIDPGRREAIARSAADQSDSFWRQIATDDPYGSMGVRKLFATALTLCEAKAHPERLARLFELAAGMQDRDPKSPGYGNLRWYWRDDRVTDRNAVEFCMQDAVLVWRRHRDGLPEPAREALRELMEYGVEGCLRHRVPTSYTNIAVLNASNLILLGELLDRPDAAHEGYRRLDALVLYTWQFGTHEYCSPTYYYPDLSGLLLIAACAQRERGRQQAGALAELLWTDVALNWFQPAKRLAGPQSRSYDYLYGLGGIDRFLWIEGWLSGEPPDPAELVVPLLLEWSGPERLHEMSLTRFPRLVRQSWGEGLAESRTHLMYAGVTLGCSASTYGSQDLPLTVDLPGDRSLPHCYFIADGREDPYGREKYATGSAGHMKALHLAPFWAGVQQGIEALGLVVYRDRDLPADLVTNIQSHFVLRRPTDGVWLGGQPVELPQGTPDKPARVPVATGQPLVLRYGTAGVVIRVLWSRAQDGSEAPAALVDDGNPFGAVRLTVEHRAEDATCEPAAAFQVRVADGMASDEMFAGWRARCERAEPAVVEAATERVKIEVSGSHGWMSILAEAPFGSGKLELVPEPTRAVLELDGQDIGRPLLESLEPVRSFRQRLDSMVPIDVPADGGVCWEAEGGLVYPGMTAAEDADCSGGRYVWQPEEYAVGSVRGKVVWPVRVATPGRYWLWGRVLAATPETDSFYVGAVREDGTELIENGSWHTGHEGRWTWTPVAFDKAKEPTPLELPAGLCRLVLTVREPGARIDRLFITSDPNAAPE
jgi:hypothetical protein